MMFNRFKSALYSAVGVEEDSSGLSLQDAINHTNQIGLPHSLSATRSQREKIQYGRPAFLQLTSPDEVSVTADHAVRPIICPRSFLPWHAGYAETVNAGKSKHNEDQSSVHAGYLKRSVRASGTPADPQRGQTSVQGPPCDTAKAPGLLKGAAGASNGRANIGVQGGSKSSAANAAHTAGTTAVSNLQSDANSNDNNESPASYNTTSSDGSIVKHPDIATLTTSSEVSSDEAGLGNSLRLVDEASHPLAVNSNPGNFKDDAALLTAAVNGAVDEEKVCLAVPKVVLQDDILTVTQDIERPEDSRSGKRLSSAPTSEDCNQSTSLDSSLCQNHCQDVSKNCSLAYAANSHNGLDGNNTLEDALDESIFPSSKVDPNASSAGSSNALPSLSTKASEHNSDTSPLSSPYFCPPVSEDRLFVDEGNGSIGVSLPYYYFSVFDGHAGWGAALYASQNLHQLVHSCLIKVVEYIIPDGKTEGGPAWLQQSIPDSSSVVVGALEHAFYLMDKKIEQDRHRLGISGGCTACIALFILGKLYVANAGDSRATLCLHETPYPMSFDFTPETENYRIRKMGSQHPELLGGEYTPIEFIRRPLRREVGSNALCRHPYMAKGWIYKRITEDDLKCPLVCGTGKRSRVMATIGVTRGFGDHDLKAQCTNILIKPFLSSEPEVRVLDLVEESLSDTDVLILGTDGLWDITTNEKAVFTLLDSMARSVHHLPSSDPNRHKYRYTSAAQDMVMSARGKLMQHNWRTGDNKHATIDDIAVFVVPLKPYRDEHNRWKTKMQELTLQNSVWKNNTFLNTAADTKLLNRSVSLDKKVSIKALSTGDVIKSAAVGKSLPNCDELKGEISKTGPTNINGSNPSSLGVLTSGS